MLSWMWPSEGAVPGWTVTMYLSSIIVCDDHLQAADTSEYAELEEELDPTGAKGWPQENTPLLRHSL